MQNIKLATKLAVATAQHRASEVKETVHTKLTRPERDPNVDASHEVALVWNLLFDLDVEVEYMNAEMDREFGDLLQTAA